MHRYTDTHTGKYRHTETCRQRDPQTHTHRHTQIHTHTATPRDTQSHRHTVPGSLLLAHPSTVFPWRVSSRHPRKPSQTSPSGGAVSLGSPELHPGHCHVLLHVITTSKPISLLHHTMSLSRARTVPHQPPAPLSAGAQHQEHTNELRRSHTALLSPAQSQAQHGQAVPSPRVPATHILATIRGASLPHCSQLSLVQTQPASSSPWRRQPCSPNSLFC